jgi:hypothetical protein
MTILDTAAIVVSVLVLALFCLNAFSKNGNPLRVFVKSDTEESIYTLDTDASFTVKGPLGLTKVVITGSKAFIAESCCPALTCVHSAPAQKPGDWIACLPNRVLVTIEQRSESEVDATSY